MEGRPPGPPPEDEPTRLQGDAVPQPAGEPVEREPVYRETEREVDYRGTYAGPSLEDQLYEARDEVRKLRASLIAALVLGAVATILAVFALLQSTDSSPLPGQNRGRTQNLSRELDQERDRNAERADRVQAAQRRIDRVTRANNRLVQRVEALGTAPDAGDLKTLRDDVTQARSDARQSKASVQSLDRRVSQLADRVASSR